MLKITKIFNNNAVQTENENGIEWVVLGNGVAFGKKTGDAVDESRIEKTFTLKNDPLTARLTEILGEIPPAFFSLTDRIVRMANQQLNTTLNNSIYVGLTDHIYHAVQRAKNGQSIPNGLTFDIQRLYRAEFTVAQHAVALINEQMQTSMDNNEAAFIALHIFNARTDGGSLQHTYRTTQIIKDILNLISYHFNLTLDENRSDYARFLTHLQYFAQRLLSGKQTATHADDFLYRQTKFAYPEAHRCVEKIEKYLQQHITQPLTQDERLYLTIHIQRLIHAS